MSNSKVLVGLDIGTSKIRTLVGTVESEQKNKINIIGVGTSPAEGINKGMITDIDEASANITAALDEAERMAGEPIHRVFVGISGNHIETYDSKGVIAISGQNSKITEDDMDRVLQAAKTVSLPSNRQILRIIPKSFSVDSQRNVKYPVGMSGIRLEVEAHIVTTSTSMISNLENCLHQTGVDTEEIIPSMLAISESVLDRRQKDLGALVIEIGACSTNIAILEEGGVIYSRAIPVGGDHVTNDLAIGLRCSLDTAEKVKIEYGTCLPDSVEEREEIDLSQISSIDTHSVSKRQVAKIIEARYHEILLFVRDELIKIGRMGMLPGGVVFCGGSAKMPGVIDLGREILQLPSQLGFPRDTHGFSDKVDDPTFAHLVGLVHFANRYGGEGGLLDLNFDFSRSLDSVKKWFKNLMP